MKISIVLVWIFYFYLTMYLEYPFILKTLIFPKSEKFSAIISSNMASPPFTLIPLFGTQSDVSWCLSIYIHIS